MLSNYSTTTPRRPLPPAKARKSSSLKFAGLPPPPPYAPPYEVLLDSPITVTAQLIKASKTQEGIGLPGSPCVEDWMNEKSREELSGLLLKADGIIKSRETELSLTSALCKSLYSDNVTLKTKHEALIARLPSTRASTPTNSRPSSPLRLEPPSTFRSPSYAAVTFPTSPDERLQASPALSRRIRRGRRISMTPAELASLADQNAELIDKLENLESESMKADLAGKRTLRKLEQEIQSLRDELETTQARGVELEEQARAAAKAVTVQKRKEEREARRQAGRDRSLPSIDASTDVIKDFAPPSEFPRSGSIQRSISNTFSLAESSSMGSEYAVEQVLVNLSSEDDDPPDDPESYFPTPPGSTHDLPTPEFAIVSQLLSKIRELEETNAQITEQRKATEQRMRAAQWDAESIRRVYDCLDEGDVDLEIQDEDMDHSDPLPISSNGTIRFSSLRRTIAGDMSKEILPSDLDIFSDGIGVEMHSTVRDGLVRNSGPTKARKTVVGLFDQDPDDGFGSTEQGLYPPSLTVSPSFRNPDAGNTSGWSSSGTDGLPRPTSGLQPPLEGIEPRRSLGSELGSEFGDDWRGTNYHLRTSSLCDLAGLVVSPTESTAALPPIYVPAEEEEPKASTPPRIPALQLTVQPPTPTPKNATLRSPASVRQYRLSQTVRGRTNRWIEDRSKRSPSQESVGEGAVRRRPSTSTLGRVSAASIFSQAVAPGILNETFESAAGQIRRVTSCASLAALAFASPAQQDLAEVAREEEMQDGASGHAEDKADADRSVSIRPDASAVDSLGGGREGVVGYVLEAWLWLQFIIVVALFLWAMAKRGPKVVLEAERRNGHRATTCTRQG